MSKATKDFSNKSSPVGVVMRSEAPLIEELLTEKEQTSYSISLDNSKTTNRRLLRFGLPFMLSLLSLSDLFRLTR